MTRYWLVTPGWSTSWIQLARIAANTSKGENTWRNTWSKVLQSTSFMEFIKITNIILIIVLKPLPALWSREGCGWTVSHLLRAGGCDKECPAKLISKYKYKITKLNVLLLCSDPRGSWGRWGESLEGSWKSSTSPALGISWRSLISRFRWIIHVHWKWWKKPEGCAGENPVLSDDRVGGEDVEAPGVDVQQDPLQLLLDEERIRERHWEDPLI